MYIEIRGLDIQDSWGGCIKSLEKFDAVVAVKKDKTVIDVELLKSSPGLKKESIWFR